MEADAMTDLRAFLLDPGDGLIPVRRAIARCGHCSWIAIMSGDDDDELAEFLRLLLMEHVNDLHPRRPTCDADDGLVLVDRPVAHERRLS
jgi:hypothetical protein